MILTGEVKMKERNYDDRVNLAANLAALDHSNGMFVVILRCIDSFLPNVGV